MTRINVLTYVSKSSKLVYKEGTRQLKMDKEHKKFIIKEI